MYLTDFSVNDVDKLLPADKWILTKLTALEKDVKENLDKFELGVPLQKLYDFIWSDFCDWYIEIVKTRLYNKENIGSYNAAVWTLNHVILQVIKMLHPYMPFITEEIYQNLYKSYDSIMQETYPNDNYNYSKETKAVELFLNMISQIRNTRVTSGFNDSRKVNAKLCVKKEELREILSLCEDYIKRLGLIENLEYIDNDREIDESYTSVPLPNLTIYLDLLSTIDTEKELKKLNEEKSKILSELNRAKSMLSNEKFVAKAPEKLVLAEKEKQAKYEEMLEDIEKRIKKFS